MSDVKSRIMLIMRARAAQERARIGGKYPFRIATWNLRLAMERQYTDEEWKCAELRKHLAELATEGKVLKCPHQSRTGQAVWRLIEGSE
jgi:hypothetical protein